MGMGKTSRTKNKNKSLNPSPSEAARTRTADSGKDIKHMTYERSIIKLSGVSVLSRDLLCVESQSGLHHLHQENCGSFYISFMLYDRVNVST